MAKYNIKVEKVEDEPYDCEDCGLCCPKGINIYLNSEKIWECYSDGHYSGNQTEDSIENCIINSWFKHEKDIIENGYTEEQRLEHNKKYPVNGIANTESNWFNHKKQILEFLSDNLYALKQSCENLPYDEVLRVKMIALWIESVTGDVVQVDVVEVEMCDDHLE